MGYMYLYSSILFDDHSAASNSCILLNLLLGASTDEGYCARKNIFSTPTVDAASISYVTAYLHIRTRSRTLSTNQRPSL